MQTSILYPFQINDDFCLGYAWSAELSRRLKSQFSLFTTIDSSSEEPTADIYHALAEAQGFYVKNFQLLPLGLKPVKSIRNFVEGEFTSTFLNFIDQTHPSIIVMQSDLFDNNVMKQIINQGQQVIVLSSGELQKTLVTKKDRAHLFISVFQHAACYNIPSSAFNIISKDATLFNSIATFFRRS